MKAIVPLFTVLFIAVLAAPISAACSARTFVLSPTCHDAVVLPALPETVGKDSELFSCIADADAVIECPVVASLDRTRALLGAAYAMGHSDIGEDPRARPYLRAANAMARALIAHPPAGEDADEMAQIRFLYAHANRSL